MGRVSEMLAKREARSARKHDPWDPLWLQVTVVAYSWGSFALYNFGTPSWLQLAIFGAGWLVFIAVADHFLRWRRRPAGAATLGDRWRAWRLAAYLLACLLLMRVDLSNLSGVVAIVLGIALIVCVERAASRLREHREARQRRQEVAELARQF